MNERKPACASPAEIEAELTAVVLAFIERWLGPKRNRTRDAHAAGGGATVEPCETLSPKM